MDANDGNRKVQTVEFGYIAIKEVSEVMCAKKIKGNIVVSGGSKSPDVLIEKMGNTGCPDGKDWHGRYFQK